MTPWWRGFAVGALLGLSLAALVTGGSRADLFARLAAGGTYLLDARLDESAIGRAVNIPAATLGEVSLSRRSWFFLTAYEFTLRLRPELSPDAGALRGLQVSVRLPGDVTATNAARVSGGTAVWERLPGEALFLRTRAVHWLRVLGAGLAAAAVLLFGRR